MAASIDIFIPHILPSVLACPDFSIRSAIIEAAIEFCGDAGAWTETLDPIHMSAGTHSYELDVPKDARALVVKNVWARNGALVAKTMDDIAALMPDWQSAQGTPAYYNQQDWDELRVYPTPGDGDAGGTLSVRASLAPTRGASTLPNFLVERHFQTIVAGALARLMLVPGQGWSNPQLAAYFKNEFRLACANAKVELFHDRVACNLRVAPRRFGG
ncbi:hypothetical protein AAKU55_005260 [Oxalobacteraceae bacterium GrIS 1.11]